MRCPRANSISWCYDIAGIVILTLWCFGGAHARASRRENAEDTKLLYDVLEGIQKAAGFFGQDFAAINVDGLFGIRLCQGSIVESLKDCSNSNFHCPSGLVEQLEYLSETLNEMAEKAMPYVEDQDKSYFDEFHETINGPYSLAYTPRRLGDAVAPKGHYETYNEEKGDKCFTSLMGTYREGGRTIPRCTVSEECTMFVTKDDTAAYVITHQLLFLIIGEKAGCLDQMEERLQASNGTSVREFERRLCGHIYSEAEGEEKQGRVETMKQDLFLEQSVLCGILGYQDFFSPSWIRMVLSWQKPVGCFGMPHEVSAIEEQLAELEDEQRKLLDMLVDEATKIDAAGKPWTGRQLMRERPMSGDCLAHKTGLAFGTMGTYLRYLIHQVYKEDDI